MHTFASILALCSFTTIALCKSLWLPTTPPTSQPYAVKKGHGIPLGSGDTWNFFPVTGNSSNKAFCLMITNGPGYGMGSRPGLFPHIHKKTYENFYSSKGRVQLWGQHLDSYKSNSSEQGTRILGPGDFGGIPTNTIHTFNLMEPDTQLTGVLVPGGFEEFFFNMATDPIPGPPSSPNDTIPNPPSSPVPGFNLTDLSKWDVYPQLDFQPRTDVEEGKAGPGNWYTGPNELPSDDNEPIWIAKNYGPKWMNDQAGYYQIIAPLVMGAQTKNLFTQGHITMSPKTEDLVPQEIVSPQATALMLEEGQLAVTVEGFDTAHLIDGDVVFVPPNRPFTYFAEAEFTKFLYVSSGANGLDAMLMKNASAWNSAFYPRRGVTHIKRGLKI
jgi:quercetin dioxygenase-like cupin family protein